MSEEQITATENMETAVPETQEENKNMVKCPCCGKMTLKRPLTPNQQFSDHWLACMMSGVPFNHTYPLYNGKLLITVTQLSAEVAGQIDSVSTSLDLLMDKFGGMIDDVDILQLRNLIRLYVSIKDITISTGKGNMQVFTPAQAILDAEQLISSVKAEMLDNDDKGVWLDVLRKAHAVAANPLVVSSVPIQLLISVLETHNRLNEIMLDLGFDENFWKGIELV